ncbi:hypothetical protein ACR6C2_14210 [Streptomyces sp. INA 01156]
MSVQEEGTSSAGQLPHRLHSASLRPRPYDHLPSCTAATPPSAGPPAPSSTLATTRLRQATARGGQADH